MLSIRMITVALRKEFMSYFFSRSCIVTGRHGICGAMIKFYWALTRSYHVLGEKVGAKYEGKLASSRKLS